MKALGDNLHQRLHPMGGAAVCLKFLQQFFIPWHRNRSLLLSFAGSQSNSFCRFANVPPGGRFRSSRFAVYLKDTLPPSPPRYWNHRVRRKFRTWSLILKELEVKSSGINDLRCQRALKMVLGQSSRAVLGDGHTSSLPHLMTIVAHGGLGVCDGWPGCL